MSDYETCEHQEDPSGMDIPSYPLSPYDMIGWVITGAAHTMGAVANTLGNIGREFFIAGAHKRQVAEEVKQRAMFEADVAQDLSTISIFNFDQRGDSDG